jgi:hypothetical protein
MGWLSNVFGKILGGGKVVEKAADLADEAFHTEQEKIETDQKDLESARGYLAPSHSSWLDVLVDGINRLQRPGWGLYLFGGVVGWWKFPELAKDGFWASLMVLYFTFLFGGRALLKDLPAAIKAMRG